MTMNKKIDYKSQGKKNREIGARFELKVRKDLESKGWIIDRWTNNIEFNEENIGLNEDLGNGKRFVSDVQKAVLGKLVTAKPKTLFINGRRVIINMWTGFPDFVAFRNVKHKIENREELAICQEVIGVESKSNGYLTKEEKQKCKWLLENKVFLKILVAKKGFKRGEIIYNEFI